MTGLIAENIIKKKSENIFYPWEMS